MRNKFFFYIVIFCIQVLRPQLTHMQALVENEYTVPRPPWCKYFRSPSSDNTHATRTDGTNGALSYLFVIYFKKNIQAQKSRQLTRVNVSYGMQLAVKTVCFPRLIHIYDGNKTFTLYIHTITLIYHDCNMTLYHTSDTSRALYMFYPIHEKFLFLWKFTTFDTAILSPHLFHFLSVPVGIWYMKIFPGRPTVTNQFPGFVNVILKQRFV